jgi:hypothetical protein
VGSSLPESCTSSPKFASGAAKRLLTGKRQCLLAFFAKLAFATRSRYIKFMKRHCFYLNDDGVKCSAQQRLAFSVPHETQHVDAA